MRPMCWLPVFFLAGAALPQSPQRVPQPPPKRCSVPLFRVPVPANIDPGFVKRLAPDTSRMPKVHFPAPPSDDLQWWHLPRRRRANRRQCLARRDLAVPLDRGCWPGR